MLRFTNKCKCFVEIKISEGEPIIIAPHKSKDIENDGGELRISVAVNKDNSIKNGLFHIVIVTNYVFSGSLSFVEFVITREKIRFSYNAFYERLFLTAKGGAECISETNLAKNSSDVEKMFKKYHTIKTLLAAPFYHPKITVASILLGSALTAALSWKFGLIYFPTVYLVSVLLTWFGESLVDDYFKNRVGLDEKADLKKYVDPDYISVYYTMPERKPFLGKVDRD